ncbi:MAG: DUF3516 domain-containing protein, partial [Acidimicrobiia bacterium]|nr:DUF3516 domain-containing protein [Acidimicrobiia bacterium]
ALHQTLSLFAVEAIEALAHEPDQTDEQHALDVLSVIESVVENPGVILAAQVDKAKDALMAEMKMQGVEYEERMEKLAEVTHPKPLADYLYATFDSFRAHHPWVGSENVRPKSVARDLYERAMTFRELVNHYGLKRSEGVVLRYLSEVYKAMVQNIPEPAKTEAVYDLTEWLGELVRQIDSSLLDEWERLRHPDPVDDAAEVRPPTGERSDVTTNGRAFRVMIRNELFRWVTLLSRRAYAALAEATGRSEQELADAAAPYWDTYDQVVLDADARNVANVLIDDVRDPWRVVQVITDPDGDCEWRITADVDLAASREAGEPVLRFIGIAA